ncbi:MAG: GAF domain-containing protein [Bacteroidales bacterium]|nr:GAF domain-containing protein [Bacteroidales bacterium]
MEFLKKYKLILILFIIYIIIDVCLLIQIRNFSVAFTDAYEDINKFYIYFIFFIFIGIVIFLGFNKMLRINTELKNINIKLDKELINYKTSEQEEIKEETTEKEIKIIDLVPDEKVDQAEKFAEDFLSNLSKVYDIVIGIIYLRKAKSDEFDAIGTYAYYSNDPPKSFKIGENITGQAAKDQKILNINNLPENYLSVVSGLGNSSPKHLIIIPVIYKEQTISIIELASFKSYNNKDEEFFMDLSKKISNKLNKFMK